VWYLLEYDEQRLLLIRRAFQGQMDTQHDIPDGWAAELRTNGPCCLVSGPAPPGSSCQRVYRAAVKFSWSIGLKRAEVAFSKESSHTLSTGSIKHGVTVGCTSYGGVPQYVVAYERLGKDGQVRKVVKVDLPFWMVIRRECVEMLQAAEEAEKAAYSEEEILTDQSGSDSDGAEMVQKGGSAGSARVQACSKE
jgi:hypothetical protein